MQLALRLWQLLWPVQQPLRLQYCLQKTLTQTIRTICYAILVVVCGQSWRGRVLLCGRTIRPIRQSGMGRSANYSTPIMERLFLHGNPGRRCIQRSLQQGVAPMSSPRRRLELTLALLILRGHRAESKSLLRGALTSLLIERPSLQRRALIGLLRRCQPR